MIAPWQRVNAHFYNQFEFSLHEITIPNNVTKFISSEFTSILKDFVQQSFGAHCSDKIDIVAHKLTPGDSIGIHNDFIPNQESHRILFHFNRDWEEKNGGYFMIFKDCNPENVFKVLPPIHGTVQGFEISKNSFHAVSKVHHGTRYTLIYSFYRKNSE